MNLQHIEKNIKKQAQHMSAYLYINIFNGVMYHNDTFKCVKNSMTNVETT